MSQASHPPIAVTAPPPRPISDLDVPLSRLRTDIAQLVDRQRNCKTLLDAQARTASPSDRIAYALDVQLLQHPAAPVSTDADYPGWTPGGAA